MIKKDISKILTSGTPKQKLMIIAEDRARRQFLFVHPELGEREPILTEKERGAILDSFKTSKQVDLWNKWIDYDSTIETALNNLQGLMFEVKMHYSNLRGYILVWNSIENTEVLVNSILHEIKDPKERKKIAKSGAKGVDFLFTKTSPDKEGYLDIKIDFEEEVNIGKDGKFQTKPRKTKELSLWYVMNNVKKEAIASAIRFISWREATLDYMKETGFNVKTYKDMINIATDEVYSPVIGWEKYLSDYENFIPGTPHKRLDELKSKYNIAPRLSNRKIVKGDPDKWIEKGGKGKLIPEIKVDMEHYNWFKDNFLQI